MRCSTRVHGGNRRSRLSPCARTEQPASVRRAVAKRATRPLSALRRCGARQGDSLGVLRCRRARDRRRRRLAARRQGSTSGPGRVVPCVMPLRARITRADTRPHGPGASEPISRRPAPGRHEVVAVRLARRGERRQVWRPGGWCGSSSGSGGGRRDRGRSAERERASVLCAARRRTLTPGAEPRRSQRSSLTVVEDEAIRALVTRLARPDGSGGGVIERAAILADGADFVAVMAWITARGGTAEPIVSTARGGLHNQHFAARPDAAAQTPRRFVLPPGALAG
jgi:hypothetical protein